MFCNRCLICSRSLRFLAMTFVALLGVCWLLYAVTLIHGKSTQYLRRSITWPKTSPTDQRQNISLVMTQRKRTLMKMCKRNSTYNPPNRHHLIYNKNKQLLFCKATKAGSTFWGRLFHQIDRHRIASPFQVKPQIGLINKLPTIDEWRHFGAILNTSKKFMIARNPLERLYSGYVDKVFSPNPFYWDAIGTYIAKTFRKRSKSYCGHDVTFPEFLQYAVHAETTDKHRDVHVTSLWKSCSPCYVKYDIIGKMETFKDDTTYILGALNLEPYKEVLRNVALDAVYDALYDTAQAYTSMRYSASKCISALQTSERIWTKLKARGFIAIDLPVPKDLYHKSEAKVFEIFKEAYSKSVIKFGHQGLKRQQNTIFLETLKRIPQHTLTQIAKAYYMDFQMFGYNQTFDELFRRSNNSDFSVSASFFRN